MHTRLTAALLLFAALALLMVRAEPARGQAPARGEAPAASSSTMPATVLQIMRGILFPDSNVVFSAQGHDPGTVKQAADASTATDPLASTYGGWEAVANAAVALTESAALLEVPRKCS